MRDRIELENIEAMRREAGIDDIELRQEVRALRVGDSVRLTAKVGTQAFPGDYLLVRITSMKGDVFRGKLARMPPSPRVTSLKIGLLLTFTSDHIHSVVGRGEAGDVT